MHDGKIFMGVCGLVYDVTKGLNFYGPGGGYHNLAGVGIYVTKNTFALWNSLVVSCCIF